MSVRTRVSGVRRVAEPSFVSRLGQLYRLLTPQRRRQLVVLSGMMLVGAASEIVSLGAVIPFVTVLAAPQQVAELAAVRWAIELLGLTPAQLPAAIAITFAVTVVVTAGLRLLLLRLSYGFSFGVGHDLGRELYSKTLQRPYSYHISHNTSTVIAAVDKVNGLVGGVLIPLITALVAGILALTIVLTLVAIDPLAALLGGGAFAGSYFLIAALVRRRLEAAGAVIAENQQLRVQYLQEGLGAIRDVILDQSHGAYIARYAGVDLRIRSAQQVATVTANAPRLLIEAVGMLLLAGFALSAISAGGEVVGLLPVLGALVAGAARLMPLIQQIYAGWSQVTNNGQIFAEVLELLSYTPTAAPAGKPLGLKQQIELRNVSFGYGWQERGEAVLRNISLVIRRGEKVAIVGRTGSGKSTLLDILMGLLPPSSGRLVVDGVEISNRNVAGWQRSIAHVPQTIYLSDASIAENIAFGIEPDQIDQMRLQRAARAAQLAGFIDSLPNNYMTSVGERGVQLSGGQRQRVGIARALYRKAGVLILDEATSALDETTERLVIEGIRAQAADQTLILVTHRRSLLELCDRVVEVGEDGVVVVGRGI